MDFKGPLPSASNKKFLLTIIDEYSRYPFAFPTKDTSTQSVIECLLQVFCLFGTPAYIHSDRGSAFMSRELREFLLTRNIASSRTTPYNPAGNGQVERYNGIIWKTILLLLKSRNMAVTQWEHVLTDALHSIRTILCTSTNSTPHDRLMNFTRRSTSGLNMPSWLLEPGPVLLKRQVRASKFEPHVDEVQLQDANPYYAHIVLPNGKATTVSTRHLAPISNEEKTDLFPDFAPDTSDSNKVDSADVPATSDTFPGKHAEENNERKEQQDDVAEKTELRRSKRTIKAPDRLNYNR